MNFELLETEVKNKLATDLGSNIDVEVMPENQAQFSRPFLKSRVEVCYKKSDYEQPQSVYSISQHETQQIELVLWARLRRGTNGIYDLFNETTKSIIGFMPTNCGKIYLKNFNPTDFKDNLWYWTLTIECKSLIVEDFTEPTTPVLINTSTQITIN